MASIYKRKNKNGTSVWRTVIRIKGHPTVSNHFDRKQEAEDWAADTERQIKLGRYRYHRQEQHTLSDLVDRYLADGVLEHHKAAKDTLRHLSHFRKSIGSYALAYITTELLIEERVKLLNTSTTRGKLRNPATVNRYFAALGGLFSYAFRNLHWIDENPCASLLKLKETPKERRILTPDEESRLLDACRQSSNPYLYCAVLIAITTGARKSEILNLTWFSIDLKARLAHIRDSKNGRPRSVGLVDSAVQQLERLHQDRDPQKPFVFASRSAAGPADITKAWQKAIAEAEIKDFVFHGLRHHFCSLGGQLGASGSQLRAQMGHATSAMTDHYSHLDAQATRFIGESIEQRILQRKVDE